MKKKQESDFVHELHMEALYSRNALTRFQNTEKPSDEAKAAHKELSEEMKAVQKTLAEKREALLKEIAPKKEKK